MADVFAKSSLKGGASLVALGLMLGSSAAFAGGLPHGGHYVAGHGTLNKATQSLTVKQSSIAGIIDWKGFSVGKHGSVTFDNGSGATLNRVTGGNLSRIAGTLHATGSLYLINSSGVIVSGTGRVITGGAFIASSGAISNSAFDDRERRFGDADAKVINRGSITSGGEAKLVGVSVANTGTITGAHVKLRATHGDLLAAGTIRATGNAHRDAQILVISDTGQTRIAGALIAHNRDGSGGSIETSGRKLSIAGKIDAGKGGSWLVDPENLTVGKKAAKTIDKALGDDTNITLKTTATGTSGPGTQSGGNGDIDIGAPLSWSTGATLILDSYHSIHYSAPVSIEGLGGLNVQIDDGGTGGSYRYYNNASVTFANTDATLMMDGQRYTLIDSMDALQAINANPTSLGGHYALAQSLDASSVSDWIPIGGPEDAVYPFSGVFDGLGHTISHLTVATEGQDFSGLFGMSSGTIRDVGLLEASVSGGGYVGALVGANDGGTVWWSYATGAVVGTGHCKRCHDGEGNDDIGGLVGVSEGSGALVSHSHSSASVSGRQNVGEKKQTGSVGGLVGWNEGTIAVSFATGAVNGGAGIGGLVGVNDNGTIEDSHATGAVATTAKYDAGGLVGDNQSGETAVALIKNSYATGSVTGREDVGGLVGFNTGGGGNAASIIMDSHATGTTRGTHRVGGLVGWNSGTISGSHAKGNVTHGYTYAGGLVGMNDGSISDSYAVGTVLDSREYIGGLVGGNMSDGTIAQSYAIGDVYGRQEGKKNQGEYMGGFVGWNAGAIANAYATGNLFYGSVAGGLAGLNMSTGTIKDAYSTGKQMDTASFGGFIGTDDSTGGLSHDYWDMTTSGITDPSAGAGNKKSDPGIEGRTTSQFQTGLPKGFSDKVWAINPKINNGLPYLIALKSSR